MIEKKVVGKVCKHCGTKNEDDFVRKSGKIGRTVCTRCLVENNKGKNNPMHNKRHSPYSRDLMSHVLSDGRLKGENHRLYNQHQTPETRKNISDKLGDGRLKGENNHNYNKHPTENTILKRSKSLRYSIKDFRENYKFLLLTEEIKELLEEDWKVGMSIMQFRCKRCDEWFTPTMRMIVNRNYSLKNRNDGCYFYCSNECKNSCSLFGLRLDYFLNNLNITSELEDGFGYSTWRNEVLQRQSKETELCYNFCEICGTETNLHVHHEKPQKTHPHLALDPDNGIILCKDCHFEHGHSGDCSTGSLAIKICTPTISEK